MNFFHSIDKIVLEWIQLHFRNKFLDKLMPFVTSLGNLGAIWVLSSFILLLTDRYASAGFLTLSALILSVLTGNVLLKSCIKRQRPCHMENAAPLLIKTPRDRSFPSCHALSSFAAASVLISFSVPIGICAYILAALIAFSRLYLYVHYPSDVLAGMAIGTVIGFLTFRIGMANSHLFLFLLR